MNEPDDANAYQLAHAHWLLDCFRKRTGRELLPPSTDDLARALYFAPFVILSHDAAPDPVFTYANLTAQKLFEMTWSEIVGLPSRYSAEPLARDARQRLLEQVARQGYIDDYCGVRISRTGKRFEVNDATVWNLSSPNGDIQGQAATFSKWKIAG